MSEKEKMELETTNETELEVKDTATDNAKPAKASKDSKPKRDKVPEKKKGNRVARYFREMRSELKKVTWPTRSQTINNTGIVLVCVIVVGACVWIFDALAGELISGLLNLFGQFFS